jgi:hypothetical protein
MEITIRINTCKDCRHLDHSGSFTVGGSRPVCGHRGACYGNHAKAGLAPIHVMMNTGMSEENAKKYISRAEKEDKTEKYGNKEIPKLTLSNYKEGDCLHWAHRVPFIDWGKPTIPEWCPLKIGLEY